MSLPLVVAGEFFVLVGDEFQGLVPKVFESHSIKMQLDDHQAGALAIWAGNTVGFWTGDGKQTFNLETGHQDGNLPYCMFNIQCNSNGREDGP